MSECLLLYKIYDFRKQVAKLKLNFVGCNTRIVDDRRLLETMITQKRTRKSIGDVARRFEKILSGSKWTNAAPNREKWSRQGDAYIQ